MIIRSSWFIEYYRELNRNPIGHYDSESEIDVSVSRARFVVASRYFFDDDFCSRDYTSMSLCLFHEALHVYRLSTRFALSKNIGVYQFSYVLVRTKSEKITLHVCLTISLVQRTNLEWYVRRQGSRIQRNHFLDYLQDVIFILKNMNSNRKQYLETKYCTWHI